jgi:hypothetical protein
MAEVPGGTTFGTIPSDPRGAAGMQPSEGGIGNRSRARGARAARDASDAPTPTVVVAAAGIPDGRRGREGVDATAATSQQSMWEGGHSSSAGTGGGRSHGGPPAVRAAAAVSPVRMPLQASPAVPFTHGNDDVMFRVYTPEVKSVPAGGRGGRQGGNGGGGPAPAVHPSGYARDHSTHAAPAAARHSIGASLEPSAHYQPLGPSTRQVHAVSTSARSASPRGNGHGLRRAVHDSSDDDFNVSDDGGDDDDGRFDAPVDHDWEINRADYDDLVDAGTSALGGGRGAASAPPRTVPKAPLPPTGKHSGSAMAGRGEPRGAVAATAIVGDGAGASKAGAYSRRPAVGEQVASSSFSSSSTDKTPAPARKRSPRRSPVKEGGDGKAPATGGFREMSYQHVGMDGASPFVPSSLVEGRGKALERKADNEARVVNEEDKLVYSKKARPVQYKYVMLRGVLDDAARDRLQLPRWACVDRLLLTVTTCMEGGGGCTSGCVVGAFQGLPCQITLSA